MTASDSEPLSSNHAASRNVLGGPLMVCGLDPKTGFHRDGCCHADQRDLGAHFICAVVTDEFLAFSQSRGNDLVTPRRDVNFPGLQAGDRWCLCVSRWAEALEAGLAPPVILEATDEKALRTVQLAELQYHALQT